MPLEAIQPGATALTRTPACPHSYAAVLVRLSMPERAAPEWPMPGMPPHMSASMLTMAPPCLLMDWLNTSRAIRKPPTRLVRITVSKPF
ncbi:hypothetical protein D3C76_1295240 [compost metagenome]